MITGGSLHNALRNNHGTQVGSKSFGTRLFNPKRQKAKFYQRNLWSTALS